MDFRAIGLPAASRIALPEDLDEYSGGKVDGLGRWLEDARKNHPAIVAARAQLNAARNKVIAASSEGLPTLDLSSLSEILCVRHNMSKLKERNMYATQEEGGRCGDRGGV
ncbi:MAG: hypothetical protein WCV99_23900, partial [Sterolibacterium sp.]